MCARVSDLNVGSKEQELKRLRDREREQESKRTREQEGKSGTRGQEGEKTKC
jgi:hypothetical protein